MSDGVKAFASKAKAKIWPKYRNRSASVPHQSAASRLSRDSFTGVFGSIQKHMSLDAGQPEGELEKTRHSSDHGPAQPPGTVEYTVAEGETLTCIAAHFDVTPSQLKKINRLSVDFLYPGQILYIPVPSDDPVGSTIDPDVSSSQSDGVPEGEAKVKAQAPVVPPPAAALVYDLPSPPVGPLSPDDAVKLDEECFQRFIKIHAKYYTSADGVVGGTLLVTPNAVMFDPDVMDPLVASSGIEPYGVMAPMETVMSATIFSEISTRHELIGVRRYTSASHPSSSSSDEPQPELQPTEDGESAHSEAAADGLDLEESIDAKAFAEELTLEDSGDHRVPAKPTTTLGEASTSGDICENQEESAAAAAGIASGTSNGSTSADLCNGKAPSTQSAQGEGDTPVEPITQLSVADSGDQSAVGVERVEEGGMGNGGQGSLGADGLGVDPPRKPRSFSMSPASARFDAGSYEDDAVDILAMPRRPRAHSEFVFPRSPPVTTQPTAAQPIPMAPHTEAITVQPVSPVSSLHGQADGHDTELCKYVDFGSRLFAKPSSDSLLHLYQAQRLQAPRHPSSLALAGHSPPEYNTRGNTAFYLNQPQQFVGNSTFYTQPQYSHDNLKKIAPTGKPDEGGNYVETSGQSMFYSSSPLEGSEFSFSGSGGTANPKKRGLDLNFHLEGAIKPSEMPRLFQPVKGISATAATARCCLSASIPCVLLSYCMRWPFGSSASRLFFPLFACLCVTFLIAFVCMPL